MRVVVALGGNALLRRGEPPTAENQRANARAACEALAPVAEKHELVVSHGNGPQVGLLALQGAAYTEVPGYPLDLLGAQTEGMIGYLIQQELGNVGLETIEVLLRSGAVVICAGGRGIPVMYTSEPVPAGLRLVGIEAVIDKDLASALLATDLKADVLAIVTDVDGVYANWGTPEQRLIRRARPEELESSDFAEGSIGPKVKAACQFVTQTGGRAVIGSITDTEALLHEDAGTTVRMR